jgi:hypothetical protein
MTIAFEENYERRLCKGKLPETVYVRKIMPKCPLVKTYDIPRGFA